MTSSNSTLIEPRIGISCGILPPDPTRNAFHSKYLHYGEEQLSLAVARAGAAPLLLPALVQTDLLPKLVASVDGLILSGGDDVSPQNYGETALQEAWQGNAFRDQYEMALLQAALLAKKPILAICRGLQLLNVTLGGSLYQDLETQRERLVCHRNEDKDDKLYHEVRLATSSWLARVYDSNNILVSSVHHQGIRRLATSLTATAWAKDDLIEAVEWIDDEHFVIGVQWHPEWSRLADPLFAALMAEFCRRR